MKVKLEDKYKELYTVLDLERAKAVIKYEKQCDDYTAAEWAKFAAEEAMREEHGYFVRIIEASAETSRNCNLRGDGTLNAYGEDTYDMDVWITFIAMTSNGFIKGGAYLSDIWRTGANHYKNRMYIDRYVRKEN